MILPSSSNFAIQINFSNGIILSSCLFYVILEKYLVTDDDKAEGERVGGFGSTSK